MTLSPSENESPELCGRPSSGSIAFKPIDLDSKNKIQSDDFVSIETALAATGFGIYNYYLIVIVGVISGGLLVELFAIGMYLPVTDCDIKLSAQEKGIVTAAQLAGVLSSCYFWGFMGDIKGRRKTMVPAVMIAFLTDVVTSFLSDFWSIAAFRYLNGFFIAVTCTIPFTYLGEFHTKELRSKAIMYANVVYSLSIAVVIFVAWLVINQEWKLNIPFLGIVFKPWRLHLIVNFLLVFMCGIILAFMPESPKFTLLEGKQEETIEVLRNIFRRNHRNAQNEYPFTRIQQEKSSHQWNLVTSETCSFLGIARQIWNQTVPLLKPPFLQRTAFLSLILFIFFFTMRGMYPWYTFIVNNVAEYQNLYPNRTTMCNMLATMAEYKSFVMENKEEECKETLATSTYIYNLILEALFLSISITLSVLVRYTDKLYILFINLIITGICGVLSAYVMDPQAAVFLFSMLQSGATSVGIFNVVTVELFPTSLRATAGCMVFIIGCLGGIIGANVVAVLLETACEIAFVLSGGCVLLAAILSLGLIPMVRRILKQEESIEEKNVKKVKVATTSNN
ncbi:unnamed protein product [Hermetia illucens]|uniref:Major facilitator superfamily (MFS) profile domain-containing protein n=1 Tax=Hermetia illucens TaxID=343691 RepID=A0A7R8V0P1_HERIL|nr:synaptic vesicle glycoprotein 2B-like [Hermetia illucens]CAD7090488.1 unnamed protein product [Hermetia illucens]